MLKIRDLVGRFAAPFLLLALLFSVSLNVHLSNRLKQSQIEAGTFKVVKVLDGDTFILEGNQAIRLADIDAPNKSLCLGKESKNRLSELILNKRVRLEEQKTERYDRIISLVYVNETFVNKIMLEEGWGRYHTTTTSKDAELRAVANQAREKKIGV